MFVAVWGEGEGEDVNPRYLYRRMSAGGLFGVFLTCTICLTAAGLALAATNPLLGGLITAGSGFPALGLLGALG